MNTRKNRWRPGRWPLSLAMCLVAGVWGCDYVPPEITGLDADSAFTLAVIPVLRDQCEGCHFSGGPMYKKMPFDDIRVVGELEDEVVIRLSGQGRDRVAQWLAVWREEQYPPPEPKATGQ